MPHREVETRTGRVRGVEEAGIRIFRGIPFAAPPRGSRRFRPPVPPEPWVGTREALRPGPAAPQASLPVLGWMNAAGGPLDEDCLHLNVWTPGLDAGRRAVLVWLHGGGFLVGSGATPIYSGRSLARRGDVVVVTINHRLGALGYAHLGLVLGEDFRDCSNLGVRDQIAALEWVRDNIRAFGGDPGNVTVFGQSAGAMSIGAMLGSPRARGLFHRAICQSGAADHVIEPELARPLASGFLAELGRPPACHRVLGRIPLDRILAAQMTTMRRFARPPTMMVWLPVVDGDLITEQPVRAVRAGAAADIPLLVGTTLDEWKLVRPIDGSLAMTEKALLERFAAALDTLPGAPLPDRAVREFRQALESRGARSSASEVWSAFQGARVMHYPASRLGEAQAAAGGSAHAYLFTWRPPLGRRALGAFHAIDIPFVFGSIQHPIARPLTGFTASAARLSRKIQRAWIRLAREGRPGDERLPEWERYEPGDRATMILGRRCSLAHGPLEGERRLLEQWSAA